MTNMLFTYPDLQWVAISTVSTREVSIAKTASKLNLHPVSYVFGGDRRSPIDFIGRKYRCNLSEIWEAA